jgi:hypothetical protein
MNINDLTFGQLKEINELFAKSNISNECVSKKHSVYGLPSMIGLLVIVRTYSAGVWFGRLDEKSGNEVILLNARRMYRWWAAESISLSAVALHGIIEEKSKIVEAVPSVWLEAIEIIPCSEKASKQLIGAKNVEAE